MKIGLTAYDVHAAEFLELARPPTRPGSSRCGWASTSCCRSATPREHPTKQQPGVQHHTGPIVSPDTELVDPLLNSARPPR